MMSGNRAIPDWISFGTLITVLPGFGYALSWLHEAAYTSVFGMPSSWISIQLSTVLITVGVLVLFFGLLLGAANLYSQARRSDGLRPLEWRLLVALVTAILFAFMTVASTATFAWIVFVVLGVIFVCDYLGLPQVLFMTGNYRERAQKIRPGVIDRLLPQPEGGILWFVVIIALGLAWATGSLQATTTGSFFVRPTQKNEVLITSYGSTYIFQTYDPGRHILTGTWDIVSTPESIRLVYRHTGTLT